MSYKPIKQKTLKWLFPKKKGIHRFNQLLNTKIKFMGETISFI
jgi:hypothetical protein